MATGLDWKAEESAFDTLQEQEISFLHGVQTMHRMQLVAEALSSGAKWPRRETDNISLVSRSGVCTSMYGLIASCIIN